MTAKLTLDHDIDEARAAFDEMAKGTALEPLGVWLHAIDDDSIEIRIEISDAARQPMGLLHGGVSMLLAESAASSHACFGVDLSERVPLGIEISGSHLRSASSGTVRVIATVARRSRSLVVHEVRVEHVDTEQLLCVGRVTNLYKRIG